MSKKKVLIITYYWPPSGGGGVQRWLKFAKYLPDFDWEPIIYTPENPFFSEQDAHLMDGIGEVRVVKRPIWEPYAILQKLTGKDRKFKQGVVSESPNPGLIERMIIWSRGNLFIPDPKIFWVKPSARFLKKFIIKNGIDVVITTGPPHSMHLIGYSLKMHFDKKVKWVADFRDPWSNWDVLLKMNLNNRSLLKHRALELKVIQTADQVLTVSPSWGEEFKLLGCDSVAVITNGYDSEDFLEKCQCNNEIPQISYFGLLNSYRNYSVLWKALDELAGEKNKFLFKVGGIIEDQVRQEMLSYSNLKDCMEITPYLSHKQVMVEYEKSKVLVLLTNDSKNAMGHLPGKFFEYMGADKRILAITPHKSDISRLIRTHSLGETYDPVKYADIQKLKNAILKLLSRDGKGISTNVEQFDRRNLALQLSKLLNSLEKI